MPLRIVDEKGLGYTTHVLDAESGEDLTSRMHVSAVDIHLAASELASAHITAYAPKVEVTVSEAQVSQVCPYCGHTREYALASARDLDAVAEKNGESESKEHASGE